jgi:DNA-binding protein YbaB
VTVGWQEQIAQNAQRYGELRQRLAETAITETSRDGTVTVTVSADGLLTGLVLKERWHRPPLPELAAQIMDCVARAQARIPDVLQQAMAETVGTPDAGAHLVLSDARQRFPEPPPTRPADSAREEDLRIGPQPEERASVPKAQRPSTTASGEDDWDERPVLEDI